MFKDLEETGLCALAVCKALDIVNQKHIEILITVFKVAQCLEIPIRVGIHQAHDAGKFLEILLCRNTQNAACRVVFQKLVTDGMHQVCLPETDAAVNNERVVDGFSRTIGHLQSSRKSHLVGLALHKVFKG